MGGTRRSDARLLALIVVLYAALPAALLAGLYGASVALDTGFRDLVFVLTVVTVIGWYLVGGSAQPRGVITGQISTAEDYKMAGMEEERPARVGAGEDGAALDRVSRALASTSLTLVLTIATIAGWAVVVAAPY